MSGSYLELLSHIKPIQQEPRMKKWQLLAELVSYDLKKAWKRKGDGDAPMVRALKGFIATRIDADDALIPYADFVS
jgi:hypothetical protein